MYYILQPHAEKYVKFLFEYMKQASDTLRNCLLNCLKNIADTQKDVVDKYRPEIEDYIKNSDTKEAALKLLDELDDRT